MTSEREQAGVPVMVPSVVGAGPAITADVAAVAEAVGSAVANPWVTVPVATGMGEIRSGVVVRAADALVVVGGEHGTLSEIALG